MSEVRRRAHYDPTERVFTFETIQDVEPIIENNKALRSQSQNSDWGRHIADIPNVIYQQWFNEYNAGRVTPDLRMFGNKEFEAFVQRKLRDPNYKYLLTHDPSTNHSLGWR